MQASATTTNSKVKIQNKGQKFVEEFEKKKKAKQQELWKKIEDSSELQDIMALRDKLKHVLEQRKSTNQNITNMKSTYDGLKKTIRDLQKEQITNQSKVVTIKSSTKQ